MNNLRQNSQGTDERFTIDEFLVALPKIISYIGKEKLSQIIHDENPTPKKAEEKSPDELLEAVNRIVRK